MRMSVLNVSSEQAKEAIVENAVCTMHAVTSSAAGARRRPLMRTYWKPL